MSAVPTTLSNAPLALGPYNATVFDSYTDPAGDEYKDITETETGFETDQYLGSKLYGFPTAPIKQEGATVAYNTFGELFRIQAPFQVAALGFALSEEAMEDGKHVRFSETGVKQLKKSLLERLNLDSSNALNTSFTTNGFDGVPFVSASHPGAYGVTYNNLITGNPALSQSGLEGAIATIMAAKDSTGRTAKLSAKKLVVPPQLWGQARTILTSMGRTGTANNDANPIKEYGDMELAINRRLTSSTAYFLYTEGSDGPAIVFAERVKLGLDDLPDFDTGSYRWRARVRYAVVPVDPLAMFGSTGLGS